MEGMTVGEPRKGKLFIIKGEKPKNGYRLCAFLERKNVGCQLHGDLVAYKYVFRVAPDFTGTQYVTLSANERETEQDRLARYARLYELAIPFEPSMIIKEQHNDD